MSRPAYGAFVGASPSELRLIGKVARMYHERGIRQPQIAAELSISQPRVSRLLRQAVDLGIVRTVVTLPEGVHGDLEDRLQERYGLRDVVVVDTDGAGEEILPALGAATADYLDVSLTRGHRIGISSWSETLLAAVTVMSRKSAGAVEEVVQMIGGLGDTGAQVHASRLTGRLAELTGAQPVFVVAPGLVETKALRRTLVNDRSVAEVAARWDHLTDALVGIGSVEPSPLLRRSGNAIAPDDQAELQRLGAVGDVCLRFFDSTGDAVRSDLDGRLVGIPADVFRRIPRRIGVAGGRRKHAAIRAAVAGGWVNVLVTDLGTATALDD